MSYDIYLTDPKTKKTIVFDEKHSIAGGTQELGGTRDAWLNVTYNYAPHFYRTLGENGIRSIYGKTGKEAELMLRRAAADLKDDISNDYWEPTEGNAKRALLDLAKLSRMAPEGVFAGD